MRRAKLFYTIIAIIFIVKFAAAQEVKNIRVSQEENQVTILFNLTGEAREYTIELFYTVDDGKTWNGPLEGVTGDAGANVEPGMNKRMIWNLLSIPELEEGYMQFKVLAEQPSQSLPEYSTTDPVALQLKRHKTLKTLSLITTVASAGTGVYTYVQGNKLYDEYQTATTEAADLHSKIETYDIIYPIAFGVAGLSTITFIIQSGKAKRAKSQLTFQPVPVKKGGGVSLTYKF